jgi:cold shock CspA family protein/ribosome-associated translation inhibitor RaiA
VQETVQVDFQGMQQSETLRALILERVAGLEDRFGRITACRVVVKAPGQHHRTAGLYEIHIRLALPEGKEVDIGHTPQLDERHADVRFAINDAFKRARRQLQDQVRRLQGHVKTHDAAQPIGTVKRLQDDFGFIDTDDGREIYFHRNSVLDGGFSHMKIGTRVSFAEEAGEKGPQASTVHLLGKHGLR